ncbi:MAG: hypothetical protein OXI16_14875 [Chloroflexota bacterium]|nr:hypothetical protein [Chloroflexota bacterium]MDE2688760.1 hypothetical protein [Chloroflexota bacterium]MYC07096.1 hypothetical protein [Chloroflexota bacterium]
MTAMGNYTRVLVVAQTQSRADELTGILERNGCLVSATTSVTTALDISGYSDFDALVMAEDIRPSERAYLRTQVIRNQPNAVVVSNRASRSVMIQLTQAFKEAGGAE